MAKSFLFLLPVVFCHEQLGLHTPKDAARSMIDYMIQDHEDKEIFQKWGYGQSIIVDALLLAAETSPEFEYVMDKWVNPILDYYLASEGSAAYNLTHNLKISNDFIGNAIGDKIGLFPHAYLHRYEHYRSKPNSLKPAGYNSTKDLEVARKTVDGYILKWPRHWKDGTVTRDYPGHEPSPWGPETDEHQFVWGDDAYMGLTLPARMVVAGLDTTTWEYAKFIATQHKLFNDHLAPTSSEGGGVYWHGRDAKTGKPSCCRWGRANGWVMMSHVEVLTALNHSSAPFAAEALESSKNIFIAHAKALAHVQNISDGRWHQLLDNRSMFLETSCTAMFTVAMVRGVEAGWLDADTFNPVIQRAWKGLSSIIHPSGLVDGICDGFGIHSTPADYAACTQFYKRSQPGLGSVIKAAVLLSK